jgi:hypothetical protein
MQIIKAESAVVCFLREEEDDLSEVVANEALV